MLQSLQVMAQFDPNMAYTSKVLNMNEMIPYVLDKMGVPNKFIRTSEEIEQLQEQEAAAAEQAQANAVQMDVDAANAKEQGKVDAQRQL